MTTTEPPIIDRLAEALDYHREHTGEQPEKLQVASDIYRECTDYVRRSFVTAPRMRKGEMQVTVFGVLLEEAIGYPSGTIATAGAQHPGFIAVPWGNGEVERLRRRPRPRPA
jgi:hypothetical protein